MLLELDVGNTSIKWRLDGAQVCRSSCLDDFFAKMKVLPVGRVKISSVRDAEFNQKLADFFEKNCSCKVEFAVVKSNFLGLSIAYHDKAKLGVDRWLSMLGAYVELPGESFVVVDAGTALTVDIVDQEGQHLGGYILPGFERLTEFFVHYGDRVLIDEIDLFAHEALGDSTHVCVESGLILLWQSLFSRLADKVGQRKLIVTGGASDLVVHFFKSNQFLKRDIRLTLRRNIVLDALTLALN